MSKLFEEMMPDNFSEFLLLSGVSGISYSIIRYYSLRYEDAVESSKETIAAMKKTEESLNQKMAQMKERYEKDLQTNSISHQATQYLRSLK